MVFKTIILPLLLISAAPQAQAGRHSYSPSQYLKNYALSACLADAYDSDEVAQDARAAAGGYLELGSLPFEAYAQARQLSDEFSTRQYRSFTGDPLLLMKCIDFFHSKELDALVQKYMDPPEP